MNAREKKITRRGMTLVELIIAISIFTISISMIMGGVYYLYRTNAYALAQIEQVELARRGVDRLTQDIREMVYAEDGAFPLARMETHLIGFYGDVDASPGVEYVEYELATTTMFTKRVHFATGGIPMYDFDTPDVTMVISNYVQNLVLATSTFTYITSAGMATTSVVAIADIRYIGAQLLVNVDALRNPTAFTLKTSTMLRNLKDNL